MLGILVLLREVVSAPIPATRPRPRSGSCPRRRAPAQAADVLAVEGKGFAHAPAVEVDQRSQLPSAAGLARLAAIGTERWRSSPPRPCARWPRLRPIVHGLEGSLGPRRASVQGGAARPISRCVGESLEYVTVCSDVAPHAGDSARRAVATSGSVDMDVDARRSTSLCLRPARLVRRPGRDAFEQQDRPADPAAVGRGPARQRAHAVGLAPASRACEYPVGDLPSLERRRGRWGWRPRSPGSGPSARVEPLAQEGA